LQIPQSDIDAERGPAALGTEIQDPVLLVHACQDPNVPFKRSRALTSTSVDRLSS
jgi:fermentation-respiration switch protein FrsA (DUF1100 family)